MQILAVASAKGGVGKTTVSTHIAFALSLFGAKCVIVDLDPQGAVSVMLGVPECERDASVTHQLASATSLQLSPVSDYPGLAVMPAHPRFDTLGDAPAPGRLRQLLAELPTQPHFVILDLAPSLEPLTTWGLNEADAAFVVVQPSALSLRTVPTLLEHILERCERTRIEGLLINQAGVGRHLSNIVVDVLGQRFAKWIFPVQIPFDEAVQQAQLKGKSVFLHDSQAPIARTYQHIARELLSRYPLTHRQPSHVANAR